jgi:hypothetical protein
VRADNRSLCKSTKSRPAKSRRTSPARVSSARKPSAKSTVALIREVAAFAEAAYPVLDLEGSHRDAHERFERACDATDDVRATQEGRVVTDADKAEWRNADAVEVKALRRLVRTRPTTVEGLRALIGYSMSCFREQGWDEATMAQLPSSILESAPLRLRPKAAAYALASRFPRSRQRLRKRRAAFWPPLALAPAAALFVAPDSRQR